MVGKVIPGILGQGEEFVKMKVRSKEELVTLQGIKAHPNL